MSIGDTLFISGLCHVIKEGLAKRKSECRGTRHTAGPELAGGQGGSQLNGSLAALTETEPVATQEREAKVDVSAA
jgi:hypothetical protein